MEKEPLAAPQQAEPAPLPEGEVLLMPPPGPPVPPGAPAPVKTRIVRALLDVLEGIQGVEPEHKDGVVRSLIAADEELGRVLGGNSKRLILRANRKPPIPVVAEPPQPVLIVPEKP